MEKKNLDFYTVEPCASSHAFEIKLKGKEIDLTRTELAFGRVAARTPVVIVTKFENYALSIYASGRIMIKGVKGEEANNVSKKIMALLEKNGAIK